MPALEPIDKQVPEADRTGQTSAQLLVKGSGGALGLVQGASCRLAPKVAGPVWGAGAQNGSSPREADSEAKEKGTRCWNQRDGGSSPSPAVYLCGFRLIT